MFFSINKMYRYWLIYIKFQFKKHLDNENYTALIILKII